MEMFRQFNPSGRGPDGSRLVKGSPGGSRTTYHRIRGFDGYVEVKLTEYGYTAELVTREGVPISSYPSSRGKPSRAAAIKQIKQLYKEGERRARSSNPVSNIWGKYRRR